MAKMTGVFKKPEKPRAKNERDTIMKKAAVMTKEALSQRRDKRRRTKLARALST